MMAKWMSGRRLFKTALEVLLLIFMLLVVISWLAKEKDTNNIQYIDKHFEELVFTDENSDNITGFDNYIVPNVVHYVVLDNPYMDFIHYLSVRSAIKHQKPDRIVIHCNCIPLRGKYWSQLMESESAPKITVKKRDKPITIFGKQLSSVYHASDVVRIEIMKTYGGIYLDNDVFVVKSLDPFRKFEFSIGWPLDEAIGQYVNRFLMTLVLKEVRPKMINRIQMAHFHNFLFKDLCHSLLLRAFLFRDRKFPLKGP